MDLHFICPNSLLSLLLFLCFLVHYRFRNFKLFFPVSFLVPNSFQLFLLYYPSFYIQYYTYPHNFRLTFHYLPPYPPSHKARTTLSANKKGRTLICMPQHSPLGSHGVRDIHSESLQEVAQTGYS